ncbi:MAG TPA: hypothetical protein DCL61_03900 [Cyanobacteria bacterium UBA12227]|nr:hypothetical protein [Cyanobacteria bacterium UBA12227]HAX88643.1 hypothetical protein [Cyanobacteria bacterium UBA11370]HBY81061.1 hypothetical protein [Cyanobacteria bacterium UBA11148]
MNSSGSSANSADSNPYRWAEITGTVIAFLTLTLPLFSIAYYSSTSSFEVLPNTTYSLPKSQK